jgi:hypothetical protein
VAAAPVVEHPVAVGRRVAFPVPVCQVAQPVVVERPVVVALQAAVPVVAPRGVAAAAVAQAQ